MKSILSICIPTFNRSDYLVKTINAFLKQNKDLEIIVSDNASTDDTKIKVNKLIKKNPKSKIIYFRQKKNVGFDLNLLTSVKLASSQYCWLTSDDDLPLPGGIKKIVNIIKNHKRLALIHMNFSRYDNLLKKITAKAMVGSINSDILFTDANEFFFKKISQSYFKFLGTNTITVSTNIINRKDWLLAAKRTKKFIGQNFIHSFIIPAMIIANPKIYYVAKPNVQYLANNHRIWANDIWHDYNTNVLGFMDRLGYNSDQIFKMQASQKEYEKRELITKLPFIKVLYEFARPLIATIRYLINSFI